MSEGRSEQDAAIQDRLQEIIEDLRGIGRRLRELHESLPAPSPEEGAEESAEEGEKVQLRSAIECVLLDSLGPAVRDLLAAAGRYAERTG
jgi:hypothetical protein